MTEAEGYVATRVRRAAAQLPYVPRALSLVWAGARRWTLAWVLLLLVQGLVPAFIAAMTAPLVDSLVATMSSQAPAGIRRTVLLAALLAAATLVGQVSRGAYTWVSSVQSELVKDHIDNLIHAKSIAVDLGFYDSPAYFDRLHRARLEGSRRPVALLESLGGLAQSAVTLIAMAAILLRYGWPIPVALLLSATPAFYVALLHSLRQHRWRVRTTEDDRRAWYYYWLLTAREAAAELRLFGLGRYFQSTFRSVREKLRSEHFGLVRHQAMAQMAAGMLGMLVVAATMAWVFVRALRGLASLGDLALFYQTLLQGQGALRGLAGAVQSAYANSLFLSNLFEFLDLEPAVVTPRVPVPAPHPLRSGIEFRNVDFVYPGSDRAALAGLSVRVPAGSFVALVGPNGAGKSTVVKLLCRLYDPTKGSIALDGVDIRRIALDELREMVTVLFQVPVHYNATVSKNVQLGDACAGPPFARIVSAANAAGAGAIIERLPHGYDTVLGTMFTNGTDLSTGEWHRIALARAFLRQAPIVALDEPTSAMDSWAEAEWLRRFRELIEGRTALVVTHRFTTAMQADVIHVMDSGRIVESGSHEDLLARGGRYAESWAAQMRSRSGHDVRV